MGPRTSRRGVVLTRHSKSGAALALIDRRHGEGVLPETDVWHPHPGRRIARAGPGESCNRLCWRLSMRCDAQELEYLNTCEVLKSAFRCEQGCGHQVGKEIPCYVHDSTRDTAQQCLVTDDAM